MKRLGVIGVNMPSGAPVFAALSLLLIASSTAIHAVLATSDHTRQGWHHAATSMIVLSQSTESLSESASGMGLYCRRCMCCGERRALPPGWSVETIPVALHHEHVPMARHHTRFGMLFVVGVAQELHCSCSFVSAGKMMSLSLCLNRQRTYLQPPSKPRFVTMDSSECSEMQTIV